MRTVGQLLQTKGNEVYKIEVGASVQEALQLLADKGIGALIVMDGSRVAGIVSERDYARKVELSGRRARDTRVEEIMTDRVIYVQPEQLVEDCMGLMTENRIRHLPVLRDDQLVGLISIGDVVKEMFSEQGFMIHQLTNYISGGTRG